MPAPKNYKQLPMRFSPADWLKILLRAREAKMKPTTFIKKISLYGELIVYDVKPMNNLSLAINRIGKNINQIVHLANEVHSVNDEDIERLSKLLERVKEEVHEHQRYAVYERKQL
jgi:hypothetical protein